MKKLFRLFLLFFLLLPSFLTAQQNKTLYYNDRDLDSTPDSATWFRKLQCKDSTEGIWEGTDYYVGGQVKRSRGLYMLWNAFYYPADVFVNYYKSGQVESKGRFIYDAIDKLRGERKGEWTFYYPNGQLKSEFKYKIGYEAGTMQEYLTSFWDSTGKQLVQKGDGIYTYVEKRGGANAPEDEYYFSCSYKKGVSDGELTGNFHNGKTYCTEQYRKGKLLHGKSYDKAGTEYTYDKVQENPVFPGGDPHLMSFLQHNIKYPKYERDNDIQGKVLLRFVVDTDGSIMDIQIIRHVSWGLDAEAVRVVSILPNFTPGMQRGQKVKVYFNLPIVYRLE